MSTRTDLETYLERAAEARAAADKSTLDNVRQRCLRAAAAWTEMAERARRTETMRTALLAEKERAADGGQPPAPSWPANIESKKPRIQEQQAHDRGSA